MKMHTFSTCFCVALPFLIFLFVISRLKQEATCYIFRVLTTKGSRCINLIFSISRRWL